MNRKKKENLATAIKLVKAVHAFVSKSYSNDCLGLKESSKPPFI